MKWIYTGLLIIIIISIYFFYNTFTEPGQPVYSGMDKISEDTLTVLLSGTKINWNPFELKYEDDVFLINQIFQGLVKFDENLLVVPDLAQHWEISPDKKVYRFQLRTDQKFHDGKPVTIDDVIASWQHYFRYYRNDYLQKFFHIIAGSREFAEGKVDSIRGLKKLSDHELQVQLLHPYLPFLKMLALPQAKILPEDYLENKDIRWSSYPVGSGPYKVSSITDSTILLEASAWPPRYNFSPRTRYILLFFNWQNIVAKFHKKDFDISFVYEDSLFRAQKNLRIKTVKSVWQSYLVMNYQKFPTSNILFRQALVRALNKDSIAQDYTPLGAATDFLSPFNLSRNKLPRSSIKTNPEEARKFLGAFLRETKMVKVPTISLLTDTINNYFEDYRVIKNQLEKVGIPVKFIFYDPNTVDQLKEGNLIRKYHLYLLSWNLDLPDPEFFFYTFFYSKSPMNWSGYRSNLADSLIRAAHELTSIRKRLELYAELEDVINKDIPMVSLMAHKDFVVYKNYVGGIKMNKLGVRSLNLCKLYMVRLKMSKGGNNKNGQRN